jgi:hypothetical protein
MAEFIRYTRQTGSGSVLVFINVVHLNSATYDQSTGDMKITTAQGQEEMISGQQAKDALAVLNRFSAKQ